MSDQPVPGRPRTDSFAFVSADGSQLIYHSNGGMTMLPPIRAKPPGVVQITRIIMEFPDGSQGIYNPDRTVTMAPSPAVPWDLAGQTRDASATDSHPRVSGRLYIRLLSA
jgi:hypothetical protein